MFFSVQLQSFLETNMILEKIQSGFKKKTQYWVSTFKSFVLFCVILLRVICWLWEFSNLGAIRFECFDTANHAFSYRVSNRNFSVVFGHAVSSYIPVVFLKGLFWLPFYFHYTCFLWAQFLGSMEGLFIFMQMTPKSISLWKPCLPATDVRAWMSLNFLHLNAIKTEAIVFRPSVGIANPNTNYDYLNSYIKLTVKNLGVLFD